MTNRTRYGRFANIVFWVSIVCSSGHRGLAQDPAIPAIQSVQANTGDVAQSLAPSYWFDIDFNLAYVSPAGEGVGTAISRNMQINHWNCHDPSNYEVDLDQGKGKPVRVTLSRVGLPVAASCSEAFTPTTPGHLGKASRVRLWVDESQPRWHSLVGNVTVSLLNLKDAQGSKFTIASKKDAAQVKWKLNIVTASAQTVNNEKLIDKSIYKKAIYQFPISSNVTLVGNSRGGIYVDTKDLFSTNERDSKSAFEGGVGYQYGLLGGWAVPLKLEEQMQGNQIATNLSSVTNLQVNTNSPWGAFLTPKDPWPAWDVAPAFSIGLPYTHRIHQFVAAGSKPLPIDDFAVNPTVALTTERLLEIKTTDEVKNKLPATFSLYWEGNLGLWYLPLQMTSKGSQRAEGYGDASILIPISDFGVVPGLKLDQTTQLNQMQLRIKYQDSVSATNNYVRTKGWTFGLELVVKK